jgi:hypothetical protein
MDYAGTQIPHIERMPPRPEFAPLSCLRSQTEECSKGISADHTTTKVYETNVGVDEVGPDHSTDTAVIVNHLGPQSNL